MRERPYDLGDLGKEYVLPFNSYLWICRIVVTETITPFAYTTQKIEIWTATVVAARFVISIRVILVVHHKLSTF